MATQPNRGHGGERQGTVKDPENDGRLKENRESGHTKGTTPGSEARAHEHGHEPAQSSHSSHSSGSHSSGSHSQSGLSHSRGSHETGRSHAQSSGSGEHRSESRGGDDLKSREYRAPDGEIHHHTRTHEEQHGKGGEKR